MLKYVKTLFLSLILSLHFKHNTLVMYGYKVSSSVWCTPEKLCTFQNLCYHSESHEFLFVLSEQSILQGMNNSDFSQLELSSIHNHNRMLMNLSIISHVNELMSDTIFNNESLFVMHSFKRDNILHVIHDDLLPLFSTYLLLCGGDIKPCVEKYRLTIVNSEEIGPYREWYQAFSKLDLLLLPLSDYESPVICFREVRIGLVRSSLWFNYGFTGVQGRIDKPQISGRDMRRFRDYVLDAMNVPRDANRSCAVLVKRTVNRRIVNEYFVKEIILESMRTFRRKNACLVELDLMADSSKTLLTAVQQSEIFVGMHGAAMALAVFLPVGATIIEMFPFAIEPVNVSPVMAMTDWDDIGLHYVFWRNKNRSLSIPPSSTHPLGGSISHLSTDHRNKILKLESVAAVPCCHDPAYLYYMFQDTVVGPDFEKTVLNALRHAQDFYREDFIFDSFESLKRRWMLPGSVYDVSCNFKSDIEVEISWSEPVNSADFELIEYEVLAVAGDQPIFNGTVRNTKFVARSAKLNQNLKLWIYSKDVEGNRRSRDVFYECSF